MLVCRSHEDLGLSVPVYFLASPRRMRYIFHGQPLPMRMPAASTREPPSTT